MMYIWSKKAVSQQKNFWSNKISGINREKTEPSDSCLFSPRMLPKHDNVLK